MGPTGGVSQAAYLSQVGGNGHSEGPKLCPHYNSTTVYSAEWTRGASTAFLNRPIGSKHPSPRVEQVFQLVTMETEEGRKERSVHGVYTNMEERQTEKKDKKEIPFTFCTT